MPKREIKSGEIHRDLEPFLGCLFKTGPTPLHADIGKRVRFTGEKTQYLGYQGEFTVTAVQYDYKGDLCYRVVGDRDTSGFGCVGHPSEIVFI